MSDVIIIEKHIDNDSATLVMHYSQCINEATIKIRRKSKPNLKWNTVSTYKAELPFELFKEVALKFIFVENPKVEEIANFIEAKLKECE